MCSESSKFDAIISRFGEFTHYLAKLINCFVQPIDSPFNNISENQIKETKYYTARLKISENVRYVSIFKKM